MFTFLLWLILLVLCWPLALIIFTASVLVGFDDDPGAAAVTEALAAQPLLEAHDPRGAPGPGPIFRFPN